MTTSSTLDERLALHDPVLDMYQKQKGIGQAFAQNPSTDNIKIREQILSPSGSPMLGEPAGVIKQQLASIQENYKSRLEGLIDPAAPFYKDPATLPQIADPKPLIDRSLYDMYIEQKPLSEDGEHLRTIDLLFHPELSKELKEILKEKSPEKYEDFMREFGFAQQLLSYLQQGNVSGALAEISKQKNFARAASLAHTLHRYGSQEDVATIVQDIALVARQNAMTIYKEIHGDLTDAVYQALEKVGPIGYAEAKLTHDAIYNSKGEETYRTDMEAAEKEGIFNLAEYRKLRAAREEAQAQKGKKRVA